MRIKPDDRDDRQIRLDWMTAEFRDAQRRRAVRAGNTGIGAAAGTTRTEHTAPPDTDLARGDSGDHHD